MKLVFHASTEGEKDFIVLNLPWSILYNPGYKSSQIIVHNFESIWDSIIQHFLLFNISCALYKALIVDAGKKY